MQALRVRQGDANCKAPIIQPPAALERMAASCMVPRNNKRRENIMKALFVAIVVMVGVGFGAMFSLETAQKQAGSAFSTSGVRLN